ncbi:hypothetical protein Lesp02_02480 [Lentzea sp. NBRC 105346]|uniref:hypothetical protein n=1 Tax=Lentzea sp. NBRC 105346 TaxID=3032205 RepID=UPI0024A57D3D|nr:hypothetical protein [Lentzea sp. NBRC 105346]GLZ28058.1 hypothetical protein Lesp02_02480 [Lentzea sp. NBRC 105346]
MTLVPRALPMISDPETARALRSRWHRTRSLLLTSMVVLPFTLVLMCVSLAALTVAADRDLAWWAFITVFAAAAHAIALAVWLRRDGSAEPQSWLPATGMMTGAQFLLGVVPGFCLAVSSSSGVGRTVAGALLALAPVGLAVACTIAHQAHLTLLRPVIAELGSTPLDLVLDEQLPAGGAVRVGIGSDVIEWTTWINGSRTDSNVAFSHIVEISAVGHAVVLRTASGRWTVPSTDPVLLYELLTRRKALWDSRINAVVERERQLYRDLLVHLSPLPIAE